VNADLIEAAAEAGFHEGARAGVELVTAAASRFGDARGEIASGRVTSGA
jgi:hypothetical protein